MTGPDSAPLLVEDRGPVRWIWFNRPHVHNAQNVAMLEALETALVETRDRDGTRVLVLAGTGPSFCAGHDLKEIVVNDAYARGAATAEARWAQELRLFVRPVELFESLPIPTVCRIQGRCLAAGLMFACAADLVVAAADVTFGSPVIARLAVADAEVPSFTWLVGARRAKQALWLNEEIRADEALALGLVNWVVPGADLDARVDAVVARLLEIPGPALSLSKESFAFMEERRGRRDYARYHYAVHQLSHHTTDAARLLDRRVADVRRRLADGPGTKGA